MSNGRDQASWGDSPEAPLVSVFTPAHNIGREIGTAWRSLLRQTRPEWEWVIVDDSTTPETAEVITALSAAPETAGRIRLYRQVPPTGSIGASKAAAAALCRGEVLIELDHDDELTPDAVEIVGDTFARHPDIDFAYSDWIDWADDGGTGPLLYPDGWGFGLGAYATEVVGGRRVPVALSPPITWETVRHIVSMPNHLRAWRTSFYRRIGGHDHRLRIADDYELLVRTFLHGTMARIPRPLYIQHHIPAGGSASRRQNSDIQELVAEIAATNATAMDRRCRSLALAPRGDDPWLSATPIAAASAIIDPVTEAAAARGEPLVSVVIPTFDGGDVLRRAIASAQAQKWKNLEILVVGDACPRVDGVIADIGDPRVRHWNLAQRAGDLGATPRNYALKHMARGSLIAYLDHDNWWEPDHLASLVEPLRRDPETAFAFSSFDMDGHVVEARAPRHMQIDTSALLHRRLLLERFGYWRPPTERMWAHDWELVSRWEGEKWEATLRPTLHYALALSHQTEADLAAILAVAAHERERAGAGEA